MKNLLLTTIAAVVMVGCGESQQSAPPAEAKTEPPTAKAPDISIHFAARKGNIEAIKQHLAAGADVNVKMASGLYQGWTPLHWAASRGHKEIVELLIAKGADVDAKEEYSFAPLHFAANDGHKEIAELLIANSAEVNAKDDVERTPLHWAAHNGRKEIVELLISKGADVNAKNYERKTPLDRAIQSILFPKGHPETADLLRKHGGKTGAELKAEGK